MTEIFDRTAVKHPKLEVSKLTSSYVRYRKQTKEDLNAICALLHQECKGQRAGKSKIVTTRYIGRLMEAKSFFGKHMITWMQDNGWEESRGVALDMCQIMYQYRIIVPAYPFVPRFVDDAVLYKFARDARDGGFDPRKTNTFNLSKDICLSWTVQQEQSRQKGRSIVQQSKPARGLVKQRSLDNEHEHPSSFLIPGHMLISMVAQKGCDGDLTCQQMLRYGYIVPSFKKPVDTVTNVEIREMQMFNPNEDYQFSETVTCGVNKLALQTKLMGTKRVSVVNTLDRRLSQCNSPPDTTGGLMRQPPLPIQYTNIVHKSHTLERVAKSSSHLEMPRLYDPEDGDKNNRRRSSADAAAPAGQKCSFFDKFKKGRR